MIRQRNSVLSGEITKLRAELDTAALQNHNLSGEILRLNESIRTVAGSSSEEEEDDNMAPPDQPVPGGNAAGNANNAGDAVQGAGNVVAAARPETCLLYTSPSPRD